MATRKKATISDLLNDLTALNIYNNFKNLALHMFEWDGLPKTIKQEYIERVLFYHGRALFFKDKNLGFLCLQGTPEEGVNVYGEHIRYRGVGHNYNEVYTLEEAVLIKNNMLMTPTYNDVIMYAGKLLEIERSLDVNVKAQKTPYILACDSNDLLSFKNIFKKIDGNEPVIYADKNLNLASLEVFLTPAPFICDKLADYRHDVKNEMLSILGINNANTDKRERLVTDEVNANNDYIDRNVDYMLITRQRAAEQINAMFKLSVTVSRKEVKTDDGELHDND